jgi:undecaprenyl-diphosphatase
MIGCFSLFVVLAVLVTAGHTSTLDEAGVLLFRSPADPDIPIGGESFSFIIANLTHLGDSIVLAIISVIAAFILYRKKGTHAAVWFSIAASGSFIITAVAKMAFGRERPDIVEPLVTAISGSFPSGHTLRSAVVYTLVAYLLVRYKIKSQKNIIITMALLIILINGISRMYLGVHWPTDILGAWLIAAFWLLLCQCGYKETRKTLD